MLNSERVNQCVESLCLNGCSAVRATITALEANLPAAGTEALDAQERRAVLRELQAIMAVYDAAQP